MAFYGMYMSPLYLILVGPTLLFAAWAQIKVKWAYSHYSQILNSRRMTGAQAAADMLRREGVSDVTIEEVDGWLSDHYDPAAKALRLSPGVYSGQSVAAVGIACHEAGHALQHAGGYAALGIRSLLVPTAKLGSWLAFPLIFVGFWMHVAQLAMVGIILFGAVVVFQIITLPVEFNASSRAKDALQHNGILTRPEEIEGVNSVLNAAAMTYVAATLSAVAQLVYFALILSGNRRRD
jgi:Zn-dependent membrane protease YugP